MKRIITVVWISILLVPNMIFADTWTPPDFTAPPVQQNGVSITPEQQAQVDKENKDAADRRAFDESPDNISGSNFMLNVNNLSPGAEKYSDGPKENITNILKKITRFLLIVIPTLAVLFIVVGAIKIMLAGGDSSKINNGKAIITYNIIAIVLALTSWSIVKLTIWIIGSAT